MKKTKKTMGLVFALICISVFTAGCGKIAEPEQSPKASVKESGSSIEFSLEEMVEKGSNEALLSVYDSYQAKITSGDFESTAYCSKDIIYSEYPGYGYVELYHKNELKYVNDAGKSYAVLFVGMEPYLALPEGQESVMYSETTVNEEVISVENEDGKRYVHTRMPAEETKDTLFVHGIEYTEGDSIEVLYVLEEDTLHLLQVTETLISEGKEDCVVFEASVEYNVQMPEMCKELIGYMEQTEDLRQVTIVADAGTSKEQKWSLQCPTGIETMAYIEEGFEDILYTDKECTIPLEMDAEKDVLAYMKRTN